MGTVAEMKRVVAKEPAEKLARKRLSILELAERLGNVSEACRRMRMDRTSFYEWKRRFQLYGLEGLKDLPPIHKTHPQTTRRLTPASGRGTWNRAGRESFWLRTPSMWATSGGWGRCTCRRW